MTTPLLRRPERTRAEAQLLLAVHLSGSDRALVARATALLVESSVPGGPGNTTLSLFGVKSSVRHG